MLCSHLFAWAAIYIGVAFDVTIAQTQPPRPAFNAFEEAIIKPTHPNYQVSEGRLMAMQSAHRFTAQHYTLRALIAAGFNLNPEEVLGGPDWIDSEPPGAQSARNLCPDSDKEGIETEGEFSFFR